MLKQPPIVSDTGIVLRYGRIGRFDILESLYSGNIILPTDVITESIRYPELEKPISDAISQGWIEEFGINFVDHPEICMDMAKISRKFGSGESAVLAIAKNKNWTVGCDDMRASLKFCGQNNVPLIGSIGILYDAFDKGIISDIEAESIHTDMIKKSRYNSPISSFQEAVDWFKNGKGRKLY